MKKTKYTLIALAGILFASNAIGQQLDSTTISYNQSVGLLQFKEPTKKELQYRFTASTIYLMDLYMEETKNDSIEVYGTHGMSMWFKEAAPKTFENFYYWVQQYFKDEKNSINIRFD